MKIGDVITAILKDKKMTQGQLANSLGLTSQSGISDSLKRDMRISSTLKILEVLGYELLVREVSSGRRPQNCIVISEGGKK